ncbi:hypothetical protein AVEN_84171-1 [Araneus ventricosus]|uniref:Uncharacterized protein n=1 Tax=Araneus ventricosus TaxID=182803 RepID=A0A4Y2MIZ0_ARAVE|nr:hypothetical protein AVEN_84171-1 [Araneus ventricosus]
MEFLTRGKHWEAAVTSQCRCQNSLPRNSRYVWATSNIFPPPDKNPDKCFAAPTPTTIGFDLRSVEHQLRKQFVLPWALWNSQSPETSSNGSCDSHEYASPPLVYRLLGQLLCVWL